MAELLVLAAESEQLELAHEIWTLADIDLPSAVTDDEKTKLVGLWLQAAALGHEVCLLIQAGSPVDAVVDATK